MRFRTRNFLLAITLLSLTGGCARYEYDLVQPPDLAGHVGGKSWTTFRRDELEYQLRTVDNLLVALVYNLGEGTIKLSGSDSAAIDPPIWLPPSTPSIDPMRRLRWMRTMSSALSANSRCSG